MAEHPEVIVIGAGIAGLAAAEELGRHGVRTCVLEARARLGGRILSQTGDWPVPIELGAEFVHGGSPALSRLTGDEGLATERVRGDMWLFEHGTLRAVPDFWERMGRIADTIPATVRGASFADFLLGRGSGLSAGDRELATHYVESFNAAPAERISAQQLHDDRAGADDSQRRPVGGYGRLAHALRRRLATEHVRVILHAEVAEIRWEPGAAIVRVSAEGDVPPLHAARAVIVTLPLGLLRAGAVTFTPPLDERKTAAIATAGWGDVVRFMLRLRPDIWKDPLVPAELRGRDGAGFGFLNAPHEKIPVWWAPKPDAPVLVGWVGGPLADRAMRESGAELLSDAVESLAHIWRATPEAVRASVVDWRWHNWRADVFARGAYSFSVAGAEDVPAEIARPIAETLFFAGEATAAPSDLGTVHGALDSGVRAAREVLRALGRAVVAGE